ncbi:MAG: LURP-one-related/scramblase family protein [Christensenellales bacterium]|jgi:uncharacterized protein YxjI
MRFLIRQKYFSIRDGFYITDEAGRNAYFVQGKIFTLGKQLTMYDLSGREILFIKQRIFRILPTFDVYQNNEVVAKIKRILPLIFVKRYKVKSSLFGDLKIKGNVFAWNFAIVDAQGKEVGRVSKKVLRVRDTYAVDVYDKQLEPMVLALTIILDAVYHRHH